MRDIRRNFERGTLYKKDVPENPIDLLKKWLNDAVELNIKDANAFVLSTVRDGKFPDSRVLLIRDITEKGLHFYTNYTSKKAEDMKANPHAAINIFWPELERQIRLHVSIQKLPEALSDDYFKTRPRASQIGAWASQQSSDLESREDLEERIKQYEEEFEGVEVPRPSFWGGYEARPFYYEFWQGRPNRLHDRIIYKEGQGAAWEIQRLYP
jgi:pyridoxamine-phosphate oxidase